MGTLDYQSGDEALKEYRAKHGIGPAVSGFLSLFGPTKREIWQSLADQLHGSFEKSGWFGRDKVIAKARHWTVTLDTYTTGTGESSTTHTRLRAPYINRDNFRFTIYRAGLFSMIGELLGFKDIRIGNAAFDDAFVVKANDAKKVRLLLSDDLVRELIDRQPRIRMTVKDDDGWFGYLPKGIDELYFESVGVIKDIKRLRDLFDLFAAILHRLCAIGSAYEDDPNVKLS